MSCRDAIRELEENTGKTYEKLYIVVGGAIEKVWDMAMSILKTIAGMGQLSEMYYEDICIIGHSGSGDADISAKNPP